MKRFCTILLLMTALGCQAQILQKGIKINYGLNSFLTQMDVYDWKVELTNNGDFGVMGRVNVWKLYLQPEVYFGINSWRNDQGDTKTSVSDLVSGWTKSVNLTIPMLLGYKIDSTEGRSNARVFAGPVFNKLVGSQDDYKMFSSVIGMGVDLVGTVSVDARYMLMFGKHEMFEGSASGLQLSLVIMF